jgi:hypothetical protein
VADKPVATRRLVKRINQNVTNMVKPFDSDAYRPRSPELPLTSGGERPDRSVSIALHVCSDRQ